MSDRWALLRSALNGPGEAGGFPITPAAVRALLTERDALEGAVWNLTGLLSEVHPTCDAPEGCEAPEMLKSAMALLAPEDENVEHEPKWSAHER